MRFLFVILSFDFLIMSSSNDHANREEGMTNHSYYKPLLSVLSTLIILFSMDFIFFGDNYKCFKAPNSFFYV